MARLKDILRLLYTTDFGDRAISRALHVSHNTVNRYRHLVRSQGKAWADLEPMPDDEVDRLFNASPGRWVRKEPPDWAWVHQEMLHRGMVLTVLWEEYRATRPETALAYSQFTYCYRKYVRRLHPSMRQIHRPGEKAFLDFSGKRPFYVNQATGERVYAELFVAVLGYSDYAFAKGYPDQSVPSWIQANVDMLEAFGGVPAALVPDCLKSAIIRSKPEPIVNRAYQELAAHYGSVVLPARPRHPKDKPKVEGMVLIVQRWVLLRLRHRTFFSLTALNRAIAELMDELNRRPFKKLPGSRRDRFEKEDKPALLPLPTQRFEFGTWTAAQTVRDDYHGAVEKHWYSVPYTYIGRVVEGRATLTQVGVYCSGVRIATHPRGQPGGFTTDPAHRPEAHRAYAERSPEYFMAWAEDIGSATVALVKRLLDRPRPALALPACDRLHHLAQMHGTTEFETAAKRALELHSPSSKTIRALLANRRHHPPGDSEPEASSAPVPHANIRDKDYYAEGGL
jgi:transposase